MCDDFDDVSERLRAIVLKLEARACPDVILHPERALFLFVCTAFDRASRLELLTAVTDVVMGVQTLPAKAVGSER